MTIGQHERTSRPAIVQATAHVISRGPTVEVEVVDAEVFEADTRPALYVIRTPADLYTRWQAWRRIRAELIVVVAIACAVIALIYFV